eukprot:Nitzschia sp. Nitz4//scaffold35_size145790//108588//111035//NITZ4_003045-RA/size145790-augustus-gene-0.123-mRNA-1//1//CDS//3329549169//3433//frame0
MAPFSPSERQLLTNRHTNTMAQWSPQPTNARSLSSQASPISSRHYIFDAAQLLLKNVDKLDLTIELDTQCRHRSLRGMQQALCDTEDLLKDYVCGILQQMSQGVPETVSHLVSLNTLIQRLRLAIEKNKRDSSEKGAHGSPDPMHLTSSLYSRNATDSLLFRLIVTLQLSLLRVEDALVVLRRKNTKSSQELSLGSTLRWGISGSFFVFGVTAWSSTSPRFRSMKWQQLSMIQWIPTIGYSVAAICIGVLSRNQWNHLWMTHKIDKSTSELEHWIRQWRAIQPMDSPRTPQEQVRQEHGIRALEVLDESSRRIMNYSIRHSPQSYFWQSHGELRFQLVKRFMDVYYAAVGTAIGSTAGSNSVSWQLPVMAGAAASFYSITGTAASQKASEVIHQASQELIQHAWGVVSMPAIKSLMLQASRLLKGASVADRLEIAGVPCFVLSIQPAPELAVALQTQQVGSSKKTRRPMSCMTTINETSTLAEDSSSDMSTLHNSDRNMSLHQFAGSGGSHRQRDVILHLTGGGFFAHTIASDLPYLLDWSASTGALVVCPEYALLPEHTFPVALQQVRDVYMALLEDVDFFGFEVNRIVVTGESTGGNLAAALCVHLGSQRVEIEDRENRDSTMDDSPSNAINLESTGPIRLPNALMLSCAALNLSLDPISHSRMVGNEDPVLPSALISAISDAYLPAGCSKENPLASPSFAPDEVLEQFPPVLMFAGSNDPLLDDSVAFNERLRKCGVSSELRAVNNVPHAYWGLGTAGFPEAQQVQHECEEFLKRQFEHCEQ